MQRSSELLDTYTAMFRDIEGGRMTSVTDFLSSSDAVSAIGSDPNEYWMDRATLVPILQAQFSGFHELGGRFDTSRAVAWTDGNMGMVVDEPTITLDDGRSVHLRATTVFRKEGGAWKVVHQHASIGVPNEQVEAFRAVESAVAGS